MVVNNRAMVPFPSRLWANPMLPPFIIEQIRQREREEHARRSERPRLELPLHPESLRPPEGAKKRDEREERGVVIIDLLEND